MASKKRNKRDAAAAADAAVEPASATAQQPAGQQVPVAGLCASAGGLDAFKKFFSAMAGDSGIAFVLLPHLDPNHKSLMVELLARQTAMPVVEVTDGMRVEANRVHVIPPNESMTIAQGVLRLSGPPLTRAERWTTSFDLFLRSLAEDQQEKAICVILSGTGSHGILGLRAVKAQGGLVMVQEPRTAEYEHMPQSAVDTGLADFVLPPQEMPAALLRYVRHFYVNSGSALQEAASEMDQMERLLDLLRSRAKRDFRWYRKTMLLRRVERRMGLHQIERLAEYVDFLREHADEVRLLCRDLLISVTGFFRDPEAWHALKTQIVAPLVKAKEADAPLRAWVPGAATGEEPYSLGILFLEQLAALHKNCPVQVFATDVDERALEQGRQGTYPDSIATDIVPERLTRFFARIQEHSFQVNKQLRDTVVFAVQNLLVDAPFSKLDLIVCRNLFIYLEPEIQKKVVALFHFALNDGGYLFLGPSETIGRQTDLFEPVNKKWRIYRRIGAGRPDRVEFPIVSGVRSQGSGVRDQESGVRNQQLTAGAGPAPTRSVSLRELTQQQLLDAYAPTSVLINRRNEVLYFFGPTSRYLDHPTGEPTLDLLLLVHEGLRAKVRTAVNRANRENQPVNESTGRRKHNGSVIAVSITVRPLRGPRVPEGLLLVTFEDEDAGRIADPFHLPAADDEPLVRQLENELQATREDLQASARDLESSNEELKASNEEVMSMNEELQSANEELETSKEELQSLNEELNTVNSQLQDKVEELEKATNDMTNLLNCIDVATVFLDTQCRIKRFTQSATQLFNLIAADVGRPLGDISRRFADPDLPTDIVEVASSLRPREKEITSEQGTWFLRRVVPYLTTDRSPEGVVLTFVDLSGPKRAERDLRESEQRLRSLNESLEVRVAERTKALREREELILEIASQEQQRIGQDLHDSVGQEMTGLRLMAEHLAASLKDVKDKKRAERIGAGLQETLQQVRALSRGLIPVDVSPDGLMAALAALAERVSDQSGVVCTFRCDRPVLFPDPQTATHLFRIAQEAITNALLHARARNIVVQLADGDRIALVVEDDGKGLSEQLPSQERPAKGSGLKIMSYRASLIDAELYVGPGESGGTRVACTFKIGNDHDQKTKTAKKRKGKRSDR